MTFLRPVSAAFLFLLVVTDYKYIFHINSLIKYPLEILPVKFLTAIPSRSELKVTKWVLQPKVVPKVDMGKNTNTKSN